MVDLPHRHHSALVTVAVGVALACVPLAVWFLVGPNPGSAVDAEQVRTDPGSYDYLLRPPSIDPSLETIIGWVAVALLVVATSIAIIGLRARWIDRQWRGPILLLTAVGVIAGIGGRVVTAAVIDANIGGGLVILSGGPTVIVLVAITAWWSARILRSTGQSPGGF